MACRGICFLRGYGRAPLRLYLGAALSSPALACAPLAGGAAGGRPPPTSAGASSFPIRSFNS